MGIFAFMCTIPIPFGDITIFSIFMWLLLFFGGALVPPITGIMLNSVPETQRTSANSFAQMTYNLIGYLPAPTFYGWIANMCKDKRSHIPLGCLMATSLVTVSILMISVRTKVKIEEDQ